MGGTCCKAKDADDPSGPEKFHQRYAKGLELGEGAFGVVYECFDRQTDQRAAVKIVNRWCMSPAAEEALQTEVQLLRELSHPNIVELYGFFEEPRRYFIVMEVCEGGELMDRILAKAKKKEWYTEEQVRDIMRVLLDTLKYCHKQEIVHRDIKPGNLLLDHMGENATIKLADFGMARKLRGPGSYLMAMCGTACYMAPEMVEHLRYGCAVDMWATGVVMFVLLGGHHPFYCENTGFMFELIRTGRYDFSGVQWSHVSDQAKDLVTKLLTVDPQQRLTARKALKHRWIRTNRRILRTRSLENTVEPLNEYNERRKATPTSSQLSQSSITRWSRVSRRSSAGSSTTSGTHTRGSITSSLGSVVGVAALGGDHRRMSVVGEEVKGAEEEYSGPPPAVMTGAASAQQEQQPQPPDGTPSTHMRRRSSIPSAPPLHPHRPPTSTHTPHTSNCEVGHRHGDGGTCACGGGGGGGDGVEGWHASHGMEDDTSVGRAYGGEVMVDFQGLG